MEVKDQYELFFSKIRDNDSGNIFYSCEGNNLVEGSICLSLLLTSIANIEAETLLQEINTAIGNVDFEEDYLLDFDSSIWLDFNPPEVRINYTGGLSSYTMTLISLQQLLEEWIDFINN